MVSAPDWYDDGVFTRHRPPTKASTAMATDETTTETSVPCPKCGTDQSVVATTTVRPGEPALDELFQGNLNKATCGKCGTQFLLQVPVVFRDDDRRFLIYCLPLDNKHADEQIEEQMETLTDEVFREFEPHETPDCRLTLNRRQFIEKIAIHMNDLDDRLVEYIKYQLYQRGEIDSVRSELLYDFSNDDKSVIPFILFDRETGGAHAGASIPRDVYDELAETFMTDEGMMEEIEKLFPSYNVTVDKLL